MYKRVVGKFLCQELCDFVFNINDFSREFMPIRGGGSLEEWAGYFELPEQGIALRGLLRFLRDRCCVENCKEKNVIRLNHENLLQLHSTLRKELKKRGRR